MNTVDAKGCGKGFLAVVLAGFLFEALSASAGYTSWDYKAQVLVTNYYRPETLTNFPVLVVLSSNTIPGFAYSQFKSGTNDLRFTDDTGNTDLSYEIENWDPTSNSCVWVRMPVFTNNVILQVWWGASNQVAPACTTNGEVWTNGFTGVWHLDHTNSAGSVPDSTAGQWNGTLSATAPTPTSGRIANGYLFNGSSTYVDTGTNSIAGASQLTVEAWAKSAGTISSAVNITGNRTNYLLRSNASGKLDFYVASQGSALATAPAQGTVVIGDSTWHYCVGSYDGANNRVFVDAVLNTTGSSKTGVVTNKPGTVFIGREPIAANPYWNGSIDEVRISTIARSTNWLWATFLTMASNNLFQAYGSATNAAAVSPLPQISNLGVTNVTPAAADLAGSLTSTGTSATVVYLCWSTNDCTTNETSWTTYGSVSNLGQRAQGETFTNHIGGLTKETLYYYNHMASNADGKVWAATTVSPSFTTLGTTPMLGAPTTNGLTSSSVNLVVSLVSTGADATTVYSSWGVSNGTLVVTNLGVQPPGMVTNALSGLSLYTAYAYSFLASNSAGLVVTATNTFTTPANLPVLSAPGTGVVAATSAGVEVTVTSTGGAPTAVRGYMATTTALGTAFQTNSAVGLGVQNFTKSGLQPNTLYYYAFMATNAAGTVWTATNTFTTPVGVPVVTNAGAGSVAFTTATLAGGLASTGGAATTVYCYWGLSNSLPNFDVGTTNLGVAGVGALTVAVGNLSAGTAYAYTYAASNAAGMVWAPTTNFFATLPVQPTVTLAPESGVWSNAATLNANVTTGATPTRVFCYWGTGTAPFNNSLDMGIWPAGAVSNNVTELTPGTLYYWTFRATNAAGDVWAGTTNSFYTYPVGGGAYWVGGSAGNSWTNAANWNPTGEVSTAVDYVIASMAQTCTVTAAAAFVGQSLTVAKGGMLLLGATPTLTGAGVGGIAATNALVLAGGTVRNSVTTTLTVNNGIYVNPGTSTVNVASTANALTIASGTPLAGGGVLTKTGPGALTFTAAYSPAFTGTLNINQGKVTIGQTVCSNATVWLNSGATNSQTGTSGSFYYGNYNLNGGVFSANAGVATYGNMNVVQRSYLVLGSSGNSALFNAVLSGYSNLVLATDAAAFAVKFGSPFSGASYYGALEFGAGATNDLGGLNVTLGGLVDPNGQGVVRNSSATFSTVTLQPPVGVTNDFSGTIASSNMALVVTNAGVQKLSGTCVYTGATTVAGGTLVVNGTMPYANGTVAVNAGGTLGGTGTISRVVTAASAATLSPGDSGIGTLTVGNLTLTTGCTNVFGLQSASVYDQILANGSLTLGGVLEVVLQNGYVPASGDIFPVMTSTGALTGTAASFDNAVGSGVKTILVLSNDPGHTAVGQLGVYVTSGVGGSVVLSNYVAGILAAPTITNAAATGIGAYSATAQAGMVSTGGAPTTVYLYWGLSVSALNTVTNLGQQGNGSVGCTLSGLNPLTQYYYTFMASNVTGECWPATTNSFTTPGTTPVLGVPTTNGLTSSSVNLVVSLVSTGADATTVYSSWGVSNGTLVVTNLGVQPPGMVTNALSGLSPYTAYAYSFLASNSAGLVVTATNTFTTPANLPVLSAPGTGVVAATSAGVEVTVTSTGGAPTDVRGYMATTTALGTAFQTNSAVGLGVQSFTKSGLKPNTLYYYAFMATNAAGTVWTATNTFTTPVSMPVVTNAGAGSVAFTTATLAGGLASTGGAATTVYCYWGLSNSLPNFDLGTTNLGVAGVGALSVAVGNLSAGTAYAYTYAASNAAGMVWAPTTNFFATLPAQPTVTLAPESGVWSNAATLNANVTTGATPTRVFCYWGTGTAPFNNSLDMGIWPEGAVSNNVTGLTPGTLYYWTFRATNAAGDVWAGTTNSFYTHPAGGGVYWVGGSAGNSWTNTANWNPAGTIDPGGDYVIASMAQTCTVTTSDAFLGRSLTVAKGGMLLLGYSGNVAGTGTGATNALVLAGGTLQNAGNYSITASNGLYISPGTSTVNVASTANPLTVAGGTPLAGGGVLTKTGPGILVLTAPPYSPAFTGTLNVDQGMVKIGLTVCSNATLCLNSGATNSVQNGVAYYSAIIMNGGVWSGNNGAANSQYGNVNVTQRSFIRTGGVSGPTVPFPKGVLTGSNDLVLVNDTYPFSLQFKDPVDGSGYYGALEFTAGTTNDLAGQTVTLGGWVSVDGAGVVRNSSATFSTVTLQPPVGVTNDFSGTIISSNMALVVTNAGVQKLSGTCIYTGATTVAGGTLVVNGTMPYANGTVAVNAGGSLGGTGTISRVVTVASGAVLSPGDDGIGTLTVSNLTLSTGSTNVFEVQGASAYDQLMIKGSLSLGGVLQVVAPGGYVSGSYLIMTNTGTPLGGMFDGITSKVRVLAADRMTVCGFAQVILGANSVTLQFPSPGSVYVIR